jgi:hypothetical protein
MSADVRNYAECKSASQAIKRRPKASRAWLLDSQTASSQRFALCVNIPRDHVLPWEYERSKLKSVSMHQAEESEGKKQAPKMPEASWRATVKTWLISFLNVTLYFPYLSISFHLNARLFRMGSFCRRLLFLEGFRTRPWVGNSHPQPASTWVSPGADLSGRTRRGPQKRFPLMQCSKRTILLYSSWSFVFLGAAWANGELQCRSASCDSLKLYTKKEKSKTRNGPSLRSVRHHCTSNLYCKCFGLWLATEAWFGDLWTTNASDSVWVVLADCDTLAVASTCSALNRLTALDLLRT